MLCQALLAGPGRVRELDTEASRHGSVALVLVASGGGVRRSTPGSVSFLGANDQPEHLAIPGGGGVRRRALGRLRLLGAHGQANHLAVLDAAATTDQREANAGVADARYKDFVLVELHRHDLAFA